MLRDLRCKAVSLGLKGGLTIGQSADLVSVKELVRRLHPVTTDQSLVRFGAKGDGGYLLPNDLDGITACFSPGVGGIAFFERDILERGIPCYLADASSERSPIGDAHFTKKFIDVTNTETTVTLDDWVNAHSAGTSDLLLQMDIEGAELPVILNVSPQTLRRFRIAIIEFHNLERLADKAFFPIMQGTFLRLLDEFHVVHIHPNNYNGSVRFGDLIIPRVLELTFLRKDRVAVTGFAKRFPHQLDYKNNPDAQDLVLPSSWYRAA